MNDSLSWLNRLVKAKVEIGFCRCTTTRPEQGNNDDDDAGGSSQQNKEPPKQQQQQQQGLLNDECYYTTIIPCHVHLYQLPGNYFHQLTTTNSSSTVKTKRKAEGGAIESDGDEASSKTEEGQGGRGGKRIVDYDPVDATGMRTYPGALAFLLFVRAFPEIFFAQWIPSSSSSSYNDDDHDHHDDVDANKNILLQCASTLRDLNESSSSMVLLSTPRIIELGAGIGLCGLLLAQEQQEWKRRNHRLDHFTRRNDQKERICRTKQPKLTTTTTEASPWGIGETTTTIRSRPPLSNIVMTDGEPLAVATALKNRDLLQLNENIIGIKQLIWSTDRQYVENQLMPETESYPMDDTLGWCNNDHSASDTFNVSTIDCHRDHHKNVNLVQASPASQFRFDLVIGTDLLYYRTDVPALISTACQLLASNQQPNNNDQDSTPAIGSESGFIHNKNNSNWIEEGVIFLPAIIRSPTLGYELIQVSKEYGMDVYEIPIEQFISEKDLENVVGWYNMNFLILKRTNGQLYTPLQQIFEQCQWYLFDPDGSND